MSAALPDQAIVASNLAKVRAAYDSFGSGDIDSLTKDFAPDAFMVEADGLPYGGTFFGPEGIAAGIKIASGFNELVHFRLEDVVAGENLVFAYMHCVLKHRTTGKVVATPGVEVFRFKDGKVVEFRPFYFDTAAVAALST